LGQHATNLQRAKIVERGNGLCRRIEAWCEIQQLYTPGVAVLWAKADQEGGGDPVEPTNIELMLPSEIIGRAACDRRLQKYEWQLRHAQAHDLLHDLRRQLLLRTKLYRSKNRFARGQRHNTRSYTIIKSVNSKVDTAVARYRQTRTALVKLAVPLLETGWERTLRVLVDDDIRAINVADQEGTSEGRHVMSWIWTTEGVGDGDTGMQEGTHCPKAILWDVI
jgi:hypothetical protein